MKPVVPLKVELARSGPTGAGRPADEDALYPQLTVCNDPRG
ncbi:hypothetical protein [Rossellomorea vietnamensis]|nr:hypothetical protein [Rossellomorea vietnamensis]